MLTACRLPQGVPEVTVRKITIPEHGVLAWHSHPMPSAVYVVSGQVRLEDASGSRPTFPAGQAFAETVDTVHRGVAGAEPVATIVFYAGMPGMPLSVRQP
jgi:quercetin dioxygenase-like cupin family protein